MTNQGFADRAKTIKVVLGVAMLWGLAACTSDIDCEPASRAGLASGEAGEVMVFDPEEHHPECQEAYESHWQRGNQIACDISTAFERGLQGFEQPAACGDRDFLEHFQLGQTLTSLRAERARYESELAEAQTLDPTDRRRIEGRLRVLAREIPELETLAQIRGMMPPADLPPELRDR